MRLALLLVLACSEALAQPCEVTIPRAPDDVKIEIETWVRAEPRCVVSLEVRVIPTEGGYYLFARDRSGHVRERFVPDAQSAGVLVASWVADDTVPDKCPLEERLPGGGCAPPPSMEVTPPVIHGPGDTPALVLTATPRRHGSHRWITFGGMMKIGGAGGFGARAEIDFLGTGSWTIGGTFSGSGSQSELFLPDDFGYMETRDYRAVAVVARNAQFGAWSLRVSGGLGMTYTSALAHLSNSTLTMSGWFPTAEASILASRRFAGNWAIAAGPLVTWFQQTYDVERQDMFLPIQRQEIELVLFGGLRHQL